MKGLVVLGIVCTGLFLWWVWPEKTVVLEVQNDTIVWLGDSIGEGYGATEGNSPPEYLARQLGMPVINASKSGDTTTDGVAKIETVLADNPGLVIIQLGGNDALRKLDQTRTEANLRQMITSFLADGSQVVVVGIRSGPFGDRYNDMYESLSEEYNLLYLPDALKGLFGRAEYMADPIHPNDAGSEVLATRVYELIAPTYQ